MQNEQISPFLKWPGGKRWFAKKNQEYFPKKYDKYIEPFLGSGAVFFSLRPQNAILADTNIDLINLYTVMRDKPEELKKQMLLHQQKHNKTYYYQIRDSVPIDTVERASRLLYLNRTCYNGMYRVNKQGKFNVPIGTKSDCIYDIELFESYAECLQDVTFLCEDFSVTINQAGKGDFVFADPPYATTNNLNFVKYNDELFRWEDQLRLHKSLVHARNRGVKIVLTNVYCKEIIEMYRHDGFYIHVLKRASTIAGQPDNRGYVKEVMITSHRKQRKRKREK